MVRKEGKKMATQTRGYCKYCGKDFTKLGMQRHLAACKDRKEAISPSEGEESCDYLELLLTTANKDYWLFLDVKTSATLADLDRFIKAIWVESGDHLSDFVIGGMAFDSDAQMAASRRVRGKKMNVSLADAFAETNEALYEYDFGSTTPVYIQVLDRHEGKCVSEPITILSRNKRRPETCVYCGEKEANWQDIWDCSMKAIYCDDCKQELEPDGTESEAYCFVPLANTPRGSYQGNWPDEFVPDKFPAPKTGKAASKK